MEIRVLLFASIREAAGVSEVVLPLEAGASAGAVLHALRSRLPQREALLERCAMAVNEEYAEPDAPLHEGDTVAVIPPVSGG